MAYACCDNAKCDSNEGNGLAAPTPREIIMDDWRCPCCGRKQDLVHNERNELLLDLLDRVETIEKKLGT